VFFDCKDNTFILRFGGLAHFHSVIWRIFIRWFGRKSFEVEFEKQGEAGSHRPLLKKK